MKRIALLLIFVAAASACFGQAYRLSFYPQYWVAGTVNDASDSTKADGREVYFYKTQEEYQLGFYAKGTIGPAGSSGRANRYMVNVFGLSLSSLDPGGTYYLVIPNDKPDNISQGYAAEAKTVTISGSGVDEAPALQLVKGLDVEPPPPPATAEPTPTLKLWFGKRVYQKTLVEKGDKFYVVKKPNIKIEASIVAPFAVSTRPEDMPIVLDAGSANAKTYTVTAANVTSLSDSQKQITFDVPEELTEGEHTFTFNIKSAGTVGTASTGQLVARVNILGGPLRVVGQVLGFPSPFSPTRDGQMTIQYTLSDNANIDIYIYSVAGELVKKFSLNSGSEGGMGQLNKVTWDGKLDVGGVVGNGIYAGTIIDRDNNKILEGGKFKITVFY